MSCPWQDFAPATVQFCEQNLCAWVRQPANTWTNIGFVIIGIFILKKIRLDPSLKHLKIIGLSAILLGFGSGLFHASAAFVFEIFDQIGMYMVSSLLIALNLKRLLSLSERHTSLIYWGLVVFSFIINVIWRPVGIPLFALQLATALTLELVLHLRGDHVRYKEFLTMVFIFALAFTAWVLDISKIWCHPDQHIINGHGIWHLLNALAIYQIFKFYKQFKKSPGYIHSS